MLAGGEGLGVLVHGAARLSRTVRREPGLTCLRAGSSAGVVIGRWAALPVRCARIDLSRLVRRPRERRVFFGSRLRLREAAMMGVPPGWGCGPGGCAWRLFA